jgi:Spy/CpxP family protein refolding chaperone
VDRVRFRLLRRALLAAVLLWGGLAGNFAAAQGARPNWNELTPAQREALAPLAGDWAGLDSERKRKWLEVAAKYPNLSPEGKQKMHERMAEFARLSPEQKRTARENFRRAYEVPAEKRQATVQKYQELPEDKKRELADRASKAESARRPKDLAVPPARPPAKSEPKPQ